MLALRDGHPHGVWALRTSRSGSKSKAKAGKGRSAEAESGPQGRTGAAGNRRGSGTGKRPAASCGATARTRRRSSCSSSGVLTALGLAGDAARGRGSGPGLGRRRAVRRSPAMSCRSCCVGLAVLCFWWRPGARSRSLRSRPRKTTASRRRSGSAAPRHRCAWLSGSILLAVAGLGILYLATGAPALDAPLDDLRDAAGLTGAIVRRAASRPSPAPPAPRDLRRARVARARCSLPACRCARVLVGSRRECPLGRPPGAGVHRAAPGRRRRRATPTTSTSTATTPRTVPALYDTYRLRARSGRVDQETEPERGARTRRADARAVGCALRRRGRLALGPSTCPSSTPAPGRADGDRPRPGEPHRRVEAPAGEPAQAQRRQGRRAALRGRGRARSSRPRCTSTASTRSSSA